MKHCIICGVDIPGTSAKRYRDAIVYCTACWNTGKAQEYEKRELAAKKKGIKKI